MSAFKDYELAIFQDFWVEMFTHYLKNNDAPIDATNKADKALHYLRKKIERCV